MMLLNNCNSCYRLKLQSTNKIDYESKRRRWSTVASVSIGTDMIVGLAHNKALIAATVCAAVGQLSKPFTASLLYRRDFDPKAAIQAGGFPSTHSSAAVATAMSVGLERGFSDSVFGLAVVYAALTMYDAQGVRREVGVHARTLNKALTSNQPNTYSVSDPKRSIEYSSKKMVSSSESSNPLMSEKSVNSSYLTADIKSGSESSGPDYIPLKESIGHTEIEVAAGALLGLLTSLAVYSL
uniref:Acid phosphatase/vanadium-dependent haloperoxidase-related protein n=1 Tax=Tanacetum cinerariifolium TaxID=118510 RepID=A0A6L2P0B9_TANCI|nr:acid phosphatase/vanadium-dependent haloperoxidase-related protein [Tanacetum cinerariifolium]